MAMQTIEELFEHELQDIYSAEQSLLDALEQMANESADREIRRGFTQHRKETQAQIKRLEKIYKSLGQKPESSTCPGIEGLIKEKKAFMREKDKKTNEAMNAIRDARRAKWQSKVADAMESFQVGGIDATHDEMLRKVEEQTAVNEARMAMAMDSVDTQSMKIEEDAEALQAAELVKQFKMEMGLDSPAPVSDVGGNGEKTIGKKVEIK